LISDLLKALSDETRLRMVNIIFEKELCVCDIMETLKITQVKASRHLGILRNAGVVNDRKSAQWVYYSIKEENQSFLKGLVLENLRSEQLYQEDLRNLGEWLKRKTTVCD